MKITEIRDIVVPIRSAISNAVISFSEMTVSAVAVHLDATGDGSSASDSTPTADTHSRAFYASESFRGF